MSEDKKQHNNESPPECSKCQEYLNGWKRAKADLINYQKDEAKRFEEMARYSKEAVIGDLLVVLESFELALGLEKVGESSLSAVEGLQKIKNQLEDALKRHGLEKIKVSPGDKFDPSIHESVGEISAPDGSASGGEDKVAPTSAEGGDGVPTAGSVGKEIESGYKLNEKVIKATKVKLTK